MSNDIGNWIESFYELNPDANRDEDLSKTKKANTLPLNLELSSMDMRDKDFYKNLSDVHKKEISLWVLMRYMSSCRGAAHHHLTMVNDLVNVDFNVISKHPELQWKLLAICGTNKKQFHDWIPPGKKAKKNRLEEALVTLNPLMKDDELALLQQINAREEFEEYFKANAFDDKTIKEIFKGDTKGK